MFVAYRTRPVNQTTKLVTVGSQQGLASHVSHHQMTSNHAFVIPVYGQPPYLSACIESIRRQSCNSSLIVISTSTPSVAVEDISRKYKIPLVINPSRSDIATDWNFALTSCDAELVTIAHQDDLYDELYVETMSDAIRRHPDTLIAFSDFREHAPQGQRRVNINVRIKRMLCARAFGRREALGLPREKLRLLALGNPVCCPSVVINRKRLPDFRFSERFKTNLDWEAWARMAQLPGEFVYVRKALVSKCVHPLSETSVTIANRIREKEDRYMFEQFWPKPIAAAIFSLYKLGYIANRM